jgi:hypothetical protein
MGLAWRVGENGPERATGIYSDTLSEFNVSSWLLLINGLPKKSRFIG